MLFDLMKMPGLWIMQAWDAREAAEQLWSAHHDSRSEEEEEARAIMGSSLYTAALFFAGIELELYIKAIIISGVNLEAEKEEWNKKIFSSHDLTRLSKTATLVVTDQDAVTLNKLSDYIKWMGRYPLSKKEEHFSKRIVADQQKLWSCYLEIRERVQKAADRACDASQEKALAHFLQKRRARRSQMRTPH